MAMIPRYVWFKCRVDDCLEELRQLNTLKDWPGYIKEALALAIELLYATTEWSKYYPEMDLDAIEAKA